MHTYTHMHTHTHAHIHTHAHTHAQSGWCRGMGNDASYTAKGLGPGRGKELSPSS